MSEEQLIAEAEHLDGWQQHKFMLLVGMTIIVALLLVSVSLWLYNISCSSYSLRNSSSASLSSAPVEGNPVKSFDCFACSLTDW